MKCHGQKSRVSYHGNSQMNTEGRLLYVRASSLAANMKRQMRNNEDAAKTITRLFVKFVKFVQSPG